MSKQISVSVILNFSDKSDRGPLAEGHMWPAGRSLLNPGPLQDCFMINKFQNTWQEVVQAYFEERTRFSLEELKKLTKFRIIPHRLWIEFRNQNAK